MKLTDHEYKHMTNLVLFIIYPLAVGQRYAEHGDELTDEEWDDCYAKFNANFKCACGAQDQWGSPEGLIDHWEWNPECYKRTIHEIE